MPAGTTRIGPATVSKFFQQQNLVTEGWQGHFTTLSYHLASSLVMEPGEIVVLSPRSTRNPARATEFHDELFPGTNTDNASGAILKQMPVVTDQGTIQDRCSKLNMKIMESGKLNLANDTVRFLHTTQYLANYQGAKDTNMSEHCWTHISMPPPGTFPEMHGRMASAASTCSKLAAMPRVTGWDHGLNCSGRGPTAGQGEPCRRSQVANRPVPWSIPRGFSAWVPICSSPRHMSAVMRMVILLRQSR